LAIIAAIGFVVAVTAISFGVVTRIEEQVITNTSLTGASFIQGFIEPLIQSLAEQSKLSVDEKAALDKLLMNPNFRDHVVNLKIWHPDGTIVYSDEKSLEGLKLGMHDELLGAFTGKVTTEFNDVHRDHVTHNFDYSVPIMEVHAPLHSLETKKIVGVAEFLLNAAVLSKNLKDARKQSLTIVAVVALHAIAVAIVLLYESGVLRKRREEPESEQAFAASLEAESVQRASDDEEAVRRIGADLHDGPAQLLALVLLKLDELRPPGSVAGSPQTTLDVVRSATGDALREIREISRGLTSPDLQKASLSEALRLAVQLHEHRTGTSVELDIGPLPQAGRPLTTCLFRFAQEGLNNAFRHAGGKGQRLSAHCEGMNLIVEVQDQGGEVREPLHQNGHEARLGLVGLARRIASNRGELEIQLSKGEGTRLVAKFDLTALARPPIHRMPAEIRQSSPLVAR
jgi:signal transduction histidine kinase